jgi:hypothetical protein
VLSSFDRTPGGGNTQQRKAPSDPAIASQTLHIVVVFTSADATLAALTRATELANGLMPQIRLLVPQVVPYPLDLDHPDVHPLFRPGQICKFSSGAPEIELDVRLCRDVCACIEEATPGDCLIVIGGSRRWWRTREHRLVRDLRRSGRNVVFVPLSHTSA